MSRTYRTGVRGGLIAVVAMMLATLFAGPLAAQTMDPDLEVLRVDLRGGEGLVAVRPAPGSEAGEVGLSSGGTTVTTSVTTLARSSVDAYTVLVVDDSTTADQIAGFSQVRDAALAYLSALSSDTRVMLVRGGGTNPEVDVVVPFTADHAAVRNAILDLSPRGGAVLWNSIARSAQAFDAQGDGIRNVVAVMASPGGNSTIPATVAQGNLISANAGLTVVLPESPNLRIEEFVSVA
ncbi:MAG: vWA domain-containing protein, partial [Acidimicrobiales bacterium]